MSLAQRTEARGQRLDPPLPAQPSHALHTAGTRLQLSHNRGTTETNEGERRRRGPPCNLVFQGRVGPVLRMMRAPPTWGRACTTVSSRARMPVAIFSSFSTRAGS